MILILCLRPALDIIRIFLPCAHTCRVNPITWSGQEVLLIPVGQEDERMDLYKGLYNDDDDISETLSAARKNTDLEYSGSTL